MTEPVPYGLFRFGGCSFQIAQRGVHATFTSSEPHHPNSRVSSGWCFPTFRVGTHYHTYGQDSVLVLTKRSQNRMKANECG